MRKYILFSLTMGMLLTSCIFTKVTYLDDMKLNKEYPVSKHDEIKLQPDDKLKINVSCKSPELAAPFNMNNGVVYSLNTPDGISNSSFGANTSGESGYVVDEDGDIDFPVLGRLHVEGLSTSELGKVIKSMLIDKGYIKDPIVTVDLLNLKIIFLTSDNSRVLTFDEKKVTLLEAIANGRSINSDSKAEAVAVIRTENGVRKMYNINLHSVSLFDSPVYYLQQNDIVYIQDKNGNLNKSITNYIGLAGTFLGSISLVVSIIALTK